MVLTTTTPRGDRAILVGIQLPGMTDAEVQASLDELERLAKTLGIGAAARFTQALQGTQAPTVLGSGKLKELAKWTGGPGVVPSGASKRLTGAKPHDDAGEDEPPTGTEDAEAPGEEPDRVGLVIVDHDLSPSQLRNLEAATAAEVLDRSSVILHIFQRHARTAEARLQVEIARLNYLAPRLRAIGARGDRQRGGIGGKGAGETAIELDRRKVRDRVAELRRELLVVQRESDVRRARRAREDTVALVGYTNAGKSSWMRALTGSDVLVRDQLFATLDTTVRLLQPPAKPPLYVSDTVGFIKRLPHDLVASFRSTLEEARDASLLAFVVDASDPAWRSQLEVTRQVLAELGAGDVPHLLVLNKADRLDAAARAAFAAELPEAELVSARDPADAARLRERIVAWFERDMVEEDVFVGYENPRLVHTIHESCRVLGEVHEETGTRLRVRAPARMVASWRARPE